MVKRAAVIKAVVDEGVDQGGSRGAGKRTRDDTKLAERVITRAG